MPHTQLSSTYKNKRVFLTGHTGFKGAWLAEWLLELGAEVYGYALEPTQPFFDQLGLRSRLHHHVGDIRNREEVEKALVSFQPDFVFHLAAQPLVRYSYKEPVETYETNVMGTIYVLEALRKLQDLRSSQVPLPAVMITTDKCYDNRGEGFAFSEEHPMGGHDPYSSSKAMDEIAIAAYRSSFFNRSSAIRLASARAGNVIGGGDTAEDRIIPDCIRALESGKPILVRHPHATRPWQHVLEPLSGYLWLGASLIKDPTFATSFNFGPHSEGNHCVRDLVIELLRHWPGEWSDASDPQAVHEAPLLSLSIEKAAMLLQWQPLWNFQETVAQTVAWYRAHHEKKGNDRQRTLQQIRDYTAAARFHEIKWACS